MSKLALSDSISARTSPLWTFSPSRFFHSRTVPSSIVSESLGMLTSDIPLASSSDCGHSGAFADDPQRFPHDVVDGWDGRPLELFVVGHRHLRSTQPADRSVEIVE